MGNKRPGAARLLLAFARDPYVVALWGERSKEVPGAALVPKQVLHLALKMSPVRGQ